jgi:preprotein translocase SecE subunit
MPPPVNALFQELIHTGIYKRSQGRITRQVTFAAAAITVALGLLQLSGVLKTWKPGFLLETPEIHSVKGGQVKFSGLKIEENQEGYREVQNRDGEILIQDSQGRELGRHNIPQGARLRVNENQEIASKALLCEWDSPRNTLVLAGLRYGLPGTLLLAGLWITYRIVNVPSFADFLISVEAEINKVSWPSRSELFRASLVVLFMIFFLATLLTCFDLFWRSFFQLLGIL